MHENQRHRILQHREGERTEEDHRQQQHPADYRAMLEKIGQFLNQRIRLARHEPSQQMRERGQQHVLRHDPGQGDNDQYQQRYDRQQSVISDRAGEQQTLVGAECLERLQQESAGMFRDI